MTAAAYPDILLHDLVKQYRLQPVVDVNAASPIAPDAPPVEVPLDVVVAQRPAFLERLPAKDRGALERPYSAVQAENVWRTRGLSRRCAACNRSPNCGRLRLVSAFSTGVRRARPKTSCGRWNAPCQTWALRPKSWTRATSGGPPCIFRLLAGACLS